MREPRPILATDCLRMQAGRLHDVFAGASRSSSGPVCWQPDASPPSLQSTTLGKLRPLASNSRQLRSRPDPEPLPTPHANLAHVYRRKVERLGQALQDPILSAAAVEAL